jgi:pimeloyl-ACP methyl ester carboxylesterase
VLYILILKEEAMNTSHRGATALKRLSQITGMVLAALVLIAAAMALVLLIWSPGKTQPFPNAASQSAVQQAVPQQSVAEILKMDIGGIEQGMILRGQNRENPVLLFLHGGPGSPEYAMVRNTPTGLEELFTVCWWDQRGAGMSFNPDIPPETMNLDQFISDTIEVTEYLRSRFGQEKIYLMGHSWGTFLGTYTVSLRPDLFHAYIGIGQISNQLASEKAAYSYMLNTARATGDKALAAKLERFTLAGPETVTFEYLNVRSQGMNKQGIGITRNLKSLFREVVIPILQTPEYTFTEKIGYVRGMGFSLDSSVWQDIVSTNLMETHTDFPVPVYILHGEYDYQVSYALSKNYFELINAPLKGFYSFANSAHSPLMEEPALFRRILAEDVLQNRTALADR